MSRGDIALVHGYRTVIQDLLARGKAIKPLGDINPPLTAQDLEDGTRRTGDLFDGAPDQAFATIETACRDIFYQIIASTDISDPAFGETWNLLDIILAISDRGYCEPGLVFWLVEELLDSQTIDGCRIVFDYLDSRRDHLTAKHFKQKNLIILRSCNELLRRLSRAEDTVFCGRVFIFLFQSFPLGDKSSVNLRGEYHIENVTTFEDPPVEGGPKDEKEMDIDTNEEALKESKESQKGEGSETPNLDTETSDGAAKTVKFTAMEPKALDGDMGMDQLYQAFWALQESFSQPTRLFDNANLSAFKGGMQATIHRFKQIQQERHVRSPLGTDDGTRGVKRKRDAQEDDLSNTFNPKYLTSRDLFDLEISDLAFRRHILVQALILLDFLLSLTPKSKKKLEQMSNRSVLYTYTLDEENTKWAINARNEITTYLQEGPDGKFYYRMVDTVLSRDKNWTHWKAEACPPIAKPPIPADDYSKAIDSARRAYANRKLRSTPMGSLDLDFLTHTGGEDGMERLKDPEQYQIPALDTFERPLADDQFDIDMARTDEERHAAEEAKSSKLWRALRIASGSKLRLFDKVDDGKNVQILFEAENGETNGENATANGEQVQDGSDDVQDSGVAKVQGDGADVATPRDVVSSVDPGVEEGRSAHSQTEAQLPPDIVIK